MWTAGEIKRRRNERELTQQQLADAVGASRRAIASWEAENDPVVPQGRFINALTRVLGDDDPVEPEPEADPPLSEADFTQTLNHLIDLHNRAIRQGVHRVLRVEDVPLPDDLPEHDMVAGPPLSPSGEGPASPLPASDQVNEDSPGSQRVNGT